MKYWIYLAWRYMLRHKSRTLYSAFGIVLTFIMCFAVLTTGQSLWDYAYRLNGGETEQLWVDSSNVNEESEELGLTEEMIRQIHTLESCEEVEKLYITNSSWVDRAFEAGEITDEEIESGSIEDRYHCTTDDLQPGDICFISVQLKDLSNLQQSAESLQKQTGLDVRVNEEVEMYLGQGDSTFPAFFRSIEVILASLTALFCIMILRNTMMISVMERMQDYGIYRCVGMSRKQLYLVLAVEGLFMSLAASLVGVGLGYGLLQALAPWLNSVLQKEVPFRFGFYWDAVLFTMLLCVAVTLYALLEPSRQAGQLSPIEAIHNNIVLRNRKGKLVEKLKYYEGGIWGKIFGTSGEYAYKNMQRNKGRFAGIFVSLMVCMTMAGVAMSASQTLYETIVNVYQGKNWEYLESAHPRDIKYDSRLADKLKKDLSQVETVQKTGLVLYLPNLWYNMDKNFQKYDISFCIQQAYEREDLQILKKYLMDGAIDYDAMSRDNGVLLCDMQYNVENMETDYNQTDIRMTEYQVGDHIQSISREGLEKVYKIYYDTLGQISRKYGIPATSQNLEGIVETEESPAGVGDSPTETGESQTETEESQEETEGSPAEGDDLDQETLDFYDTETEGFEKYRAEFLHIIREQGIDLACQESEITYMRQFRSDLLPSWAMQQGYANDYVIQGIISENPLFKLEGMGDTAVELIGTVDMVDQREIYNSYKSILDEYYWTWVIQIKRDPEEIADESVRNYCNTQAYCQLDYGCASGDMEGFNLEEYLDMCHTMQIARVVAILFMGCIGLICLIQLYNTLCANLLIRNRELWLYEVVGMGRRQKWRMLLLEHLSAAILAVVTGYFVAWGISWFFIDYLLNLDGFIQYVWPGVSVVLAGSIIILLTCLVCLAGIRSSKRSVH